MCAIDFSIHLTIFNRLEMEHSLRWQYCNKTFLAINFVFFLISRIQISNLMQILCTHRLESNYTHRWIHLPDIQYVKLKLLQTSRNKMIFVSIGPNFNSTIKVELQRCIHVFNWTFSTGFSTFYTVFYLRFQFFFMDDWFICEWWKIALICCCCRGCGMYEHWKSFAIFL